MAGIHKLTDREVKTGQGPWLSDGGNLLLNVSGNSRLWIFRYKVAGKQKPMSIGSYPEVSLADARGKAAELRKQLANGIDPKAHRASAALEASAVFTFDQVRDQYIANKMQDFTAKSRESWRSSLATYATPFFGDVPVGQVDAVLVQKALDPIWLTISDTAHRVRARIEAVLSYAKARKYRSGENPAVWRDNLEHVYAARRKAKNHPALEHKDVPAFMTWLRAHSSLAALPLEFTVLTAARASEATDAKWCEMDLDAKTWTVPAERMKMDKAHIVPLSDAAVAVLEKAKARRRPDDFVFPGWVHGKQITSEMMLKLVREFQAGLTVHGMRACFKTWATSETTFANEVSEMALAHKVGSKVEQAYQRGSMVTRRRELMDAWAGYCSGESNVLPMRRTA
jgi:integrase